MLEYRLSGDSYLQLNEGKALMASGKAGRGAIEDIYSGVYKSGSSFNIITHIMTRWKGLMDDQRRKSVFVPFSLNSLSLPCSSARFFQGGIDYIFNTMETQVCKGDDFIHKSDIICSVLQGSFPANSAGDFQKRLQKYIQLSNTLYSRFYQGKEEAPRVLLDFSHVLANDLHFECVKNNHFKTSINGRAEELTSIITPENKVDFSQVSRGFRRIKWADIGGLFEPKKKMRDYLGDFYNPEVSKRLGLDPSQAVP